MRVCLDIDGVTADLATPANDWLAEWVGTVPRPVATWDWFELYGEQGQKAWKAFWHHCQNSEFMLELEPIPGAKTEIAALLDHGFDLSFVTARNPKFYREQTRTWLDRQGFHDIPLTFERDKASLRYDWYVDDKPEVLESVCAAGLGSICFIQPYNAFWYLMQPDRPPGHPGILAGRSWVEVGRFLLEEKSLRSWREKGFVG